MKTTIGTKNIGRPAPRWFRITKRVVYLAQAGGIFAGVLTRFGITAEDQLLIVGVITIVMEALGGALANGEDYIVNEKK
jgi:hypothetical protein